MTGIEKGLLTVGLAGWILLGIAHTAIVMTGPRGWRPDRSAPGAAAVVGIPGETDPATVGAARALLDPESGGSPIAERVVERPNTVAVVLPEPTDSADLLYIRYQLSHLLYPRRVQVARDVSSSDPVDPSSTAPTMIVAPGANPPAGCAPVAEVEGHRLLRCGRQ